MQSDSHLTSKLARQYLDAAWPPDVRKASGFPVAVSLKSSNRLRLVRARRIASLN